MCRGMDIHSKSRGSRKSLDPRKHCTEELRGGVAIARGTPLLSGRWTRRRWEVLAPVISGWCGAFAGGLIGHSCGGPVLAVVDHENLLVFGTSSESTFQRPRKRACFFFLDVIHIYQWKLYNF